MAFITREEALKRLRAQGVAGKPIVGCGAGTGISAKCAEAGGADLIIIYNSGRYRMAGRGSLAGLLSYGDANGIVVEMAAEVLPVVKNTPVLAGRQRHRSVPADARLPQADQGDGLHRRAELPHRRPDRRQLPRQPGSHRHGLRQGNRSHRRGAQAGPVDHARTCSTPTRRSRWPRRARTCWWRTLA